MSDEIAIRVNNVSKNFRLPHEKSSTLKGVFTSLVSKKRKGYETQHALKNISFEVKTGEFFGIVGRNGSGKSTLLKILANIYQPNKGTVEVRGKLVPFIELGVGFNPELSGRENVFLNGALLGFSRKEMQAMYKDIVEFAELERFMDQKLKNYSSGMQVRLAFSLAIRANTDILLVDEVLAVGDADFQRKCFEYFKTLKRNNKTVVFVTHDMDAIREYCDRALMIEGSKIVKIGSPDSIAQSYHKLFATPTTNKEGASQDRWGDKLAYTSDMSIQLESNTITVTQKVMANQSLSGPVIGFRIRDAAGKEVTGTNTAIENTKIHDLRQGKSITLEWRFANILADGQYLIDPAVLHQDGITVSDWWNDSKRFTVKKNRHLPYTLDPGFTLRVSND
ncbi:ABC transporter ATP-binding protein [Candidatus Saccharibacteria bacterium]|nr:ABC transporter ATP-binding protein [Candidatus Saccharibacteria bacterium]